MNWTIKKRPFIWPCSCFKYSHFTLKMATMLPPPQAKSQEKKERERERTNNCPSIKQAKNNVGWEVEETNLSSFSASFLATKALNSGVIPKLFSSSFSMTALQQISLKVQPWPNENDVLDSCMLCKGRQAADKSSFLQGPAVQFQTTQASQAAKF